MLLNINDDDFFENPDTRAVRTAITDLAVDHFAVLSRGNEVYVQTYHNDDGTFQLEYRDGSAEQHYAAEADDLSAADIAKVFERYAENVGDWKDSLKWHPVDFDDDFSGDLTADNAYLLNGEEFEKVAVGAERLPIALQADRCAVCAAMVGAYHEEGCNQEECPRCHGQLLECDCE